MIAVLLLQAAVPSLPMPPLDWTPLPVFPLSRMAVANDGSAYVRGEVAAGRCVAPAPLPDGTRMVAPVAILVAANGTVSRIVPRAIGCPTVEQYTVGTLLSATRTVPPGAAPLAPGWYRLAVSYKW